MVINYINNIMKNIYIMEEEIWKDIKGYEGLYQVSNLGRVKSLDKYVNCKNNHKRLISGKF